MAMTIPKGVSHQPIPHQRARWAFLVGSPVSSNPYPVGSSESLAWMANWFQEQADHDESVAALCHERGRTKK